MSTQRRFMSQAETLSPFPDGFRMPIEHEWTPNPVMLRPGTSSAVLSGLSESALSAYRAERSACSDRGPVSRWSGSSLGYWSVTYKLSDGSRAGLAKLMPPRDKEPVTFTSIVNNIVSNAALHSFAVLHIMYFDKELDSFALLTPHTAQFSEDRFEVFVEPSATPFPAGGDRALALLSAAPSASSGFAVSAELRAAFLREEPECRTRIASEESTCRLTMIARFAVQAEAIALALAREAP